MNTHKVLVPPSGVADLRSLYDESGEKEGSSPGEPFQYLSTVHTSRVSFHSLAHVKKLRFVDRVNADSNLPNENFT